ncbi:MAG TPA: sugar ABC transporter substrate-binding protein [Candidatus Pullilachnospira intestinigallinarum]|nr:sugar ABC transporter substrate-binding protein [Candidatus Pullilachnospira intestinigallinarum]
MKKKMVNAVALMMLGILAVSGCGGSGNTTEDGSNEKTANSEESSDGKTVINFYYWDEGQKEGMDDLIALFEESQDEVVVESTIVPWGEYWTKLQTALPTGTGPDVFWMNMDAPTYIDAGLLLDLTDALESAGVDMSKYPEAVTEMYESDGKIYGVPKDYDGMALYYNKAIFDEMEVEYPQAGWTWDDLLEKAQALTNDSHYGFVARSDGNSGYQNFVYQNGGSLTDENDMPQVNTKEVAEALQFEHDLMYKYKVSPTGAELLEFAADDMFVAGQAAMITSGSWSIQTYVDALGADCQVAELPVKVTQGATTHGLAYCVAANSSNKEAALKFVEFAASKEAQEATAKAAIPAYEGAADIWKELYPDQDVQILLDSVEYASPNPYYANNNSEVAQIFTDTISAIWTDENADIQSMLDDAQEKMMETVNKE